MSRLGRTIVGLLTARLLQPLLSFALFSVLARTLPLSDFGNYVLLMGLILIFQSLAALGLGPLLTREAALTPLDSGRWLGGASLVLLPASLLSAAAFPAACLLLGYTREVAVGAAVLGGCLPFAAFVTLAESLFVAHHAGGAVVRQSAIENTIRVAVSLTVVFSGGGLVALCWAYAVSKVAGALQAGAYLRRLLQPPRFVLDRDRAARVLGKARLYGPMVALAMIFFRVDVLVLSVMFSEADVGLYGAAYRLVMLAFIFPESFVGALFPVLSTRLREDPVAAARLIGQAARIMVCLEVPACLGLAALAPWLMPLLFGPSFAAAAPVLTLIAFLLPAHSLSSLLGFSLQAQHREGMALAMVGVALAANLLANVVGVAAFGLPGAAWGSLAGYFTSAAIHILAVSRPGFRLPLPGSLSPALWAFLVGLPFLFASGSQPGLRLLAPVAGTVVIAAAGLITPAGLRQAVALVRRGEA